MRLFCVISKLKSYILFLVTLSVIAAISLAGFNKYYLLSEREVKNINSQSCFNAVVDSFPYFRNDNKTGFFATISEHRNEKLNGRRVYFVIKNHKFSFGKGDTLKITGKIQTAMSAGNDSAFDYAEYLKSQNCIGVCYPKAEKVSVYSHYSGIFSKIYKIRTDFINNTLKHLPSRNAALLQAVICGERTGLESKYESAFKSAGIFHIVAISGLHLNLFICIIFAALSKLRLKRVPKSILSLLLSLLIGLFVLFFTGMGVSVIRAFIMMLILNISNAMPRKPNSKHALILTAYIILIFMPYNIYSVSFMLSTLSTLGVLVSADVIGFLKNKNILYFIHSSYVGNTILVSVMTTLFTLPVTCVSFGYISLYAFAANTFVLPVMGYFLGIGALFAIISIFPVTFITHIFTFILYIISEYIILISLFIERLPMSTVNIYPMYLQIIFFVLAVLAICCYTYKRYGIKIASALFSIFLISAVVMTMLPSTRESIEVTFADVGQGDCAIIQTDDADLMVDCGTLGNKSFTYSAIESVLKSKNISHLDMVFVSHFHSDHMNVIAELIEDSKVKSLAIPRYYNISDISARENKNELIDACIKTDTKVYFLSDGTHINIGESLKIDVFSPTHDMVSDNNNMSAIMNFSFGKSDFMFCGDAGDDGMEILNSLNKDCDVIKIPHHGGYSEECTKYLDKCNAKYALISCGENNPYGHPKSKILKSISESDIECYRTDTCGAVTFVADKEENFSVKTVR